MESKKSWTNGAAVTRSGERPWKNRPHISNPWSKEHCDSELSDEKIIRIYGKQWDIEVNLKIMKHYLNLGREVQLRNYDGLVGHITVAMSRYVFLAFEQRCHDDPRTLGSLFSACCEEVKDLNFLDAVGRLSMLVGGQHGDILLIFLSRTVRYPVHNICCDERYYAGNTNRPVKNTHTICRQNNQHLPGQIPAQILYPHR